MNQEEVKRLASAMERDFADAPEPDWSIAEASPAVRVIDCVLSLRQDYHAAVLPRVKQFAASCPETRTMSELMALIDREGGPEPFIRGWLKFNSPTKGVAIYRVAEYLLDQQGRFEGADESSRLAGWAQWARPGDYLSLSIPRFGLAGFQYLRMLFGADTAKPDVHILRYVTHAVGRRVSEPQALYLLHRAAELSGQSVRRLDNLIWERGARGSSG